MFRKSIIALGATTAIVMAALPSAAIAKNGGNHGNRGHFGHYFGGSSIPTSCYRYQWVETRRGWRKIIVNICEDDDDD